MLTRGAARFPCASAFCRLPSACHFRQSSRACWTRQLLQQRSINQGRISGCIVWKAEISASPRHTGGGSTFTLNAPTMPGCRTHEAIVYSGYFCFDGEALAGGGAGVVAAGGGSGVSSFFTESGSSLAWATRRATCQSCVSVSAPLKLGIPVSRIPLAAFQ